MPHSDSLISSVRKFEEMPVVQCWQMYNKSSTATTHKVMPSTYLHLVFPISGEITVSGVPFPISDPFFAPILSCFKTIKLEAGSSIFGVHIQAFFCSEIFRCSPSELIRNAHLVKDILTPRMVASLKDAVLLTQDFDQRVNAVLRFFDGLLGINQNLIKRRAMSDFMDLLNFDPSHSPGKAAREIGYSSRWMQKIHKELIGVSPSEMTRIIRFNKFINKLHSNGSTATQLALECGYYDQAHAIRDFKIFGGITPGKFAKMQHYISRVLNIQ